MSFELEPEKPQEGNGKWETGQLPASLREDVYARDGGVCRMCGAAAESLAIHHIRYRSEGGLNVIENLISVHWMFAPRCHEKIHANKGRWQEIALYAARNPGLTMLQVERWQRTDTRRPR